MIERPSGVYYRGRSKECFFIRATPPCRNTAASRVEGDYVIMHVCAEHVEKAMDVGGPASDVVDLVPAGDLDFMPGVPADILGALRDFPEVEMIVDFDRNVYRRPTPSPENS